MAVKPAGSKGYLLTLDAMVALTIFFLALIAGLIYLAQPESPRALYLKQVSQDVLVVASRTPVLDTALGGNSTALRDLLRKAPSNICLQFSIYDSISNQTLISDPSCITYSGTLQTTNGYYYSNGKTYHTRMDSWYR